MKNTLINRKATIEVAKALGELNEQVVFVGGAVVSLYIDDPAADDVRPTKDIDLTFEIASLSHLETLRKELIKKGFRHSHEDKVVCRFRLDDKIVDVMATKEVGWAPANRWFQPGFTRAITRLLNDVEIKLLPFPYFLASKFDAFKSRGGKDPRTSHDFEDIVYLLNYTSDFPELILASAHDLKSYLIKCFDEVVSSDSLQESISSNLYYEEQNERLEHINNLMKKTIQGI